MKQTAAIFAMAVLLAGCASAPIPAPVATFDNAQTARKLPMQFQVGKFEKAASLSDGANTSINVRALALSAQSYGSYANDLRETLITDLRASNMLADDAPWTITATLTENAMGSPTTSGYGHVAARWVVHSAQGVCYDKTLEIDETWPASILAAIAIPRTARKYTAMHSRLVGKFLSDPSLAQGCARPQ